VPVPWRAAFHAREARTGAGQKRARYNSEQRGGTALTPGVGGIAEAVDQLVGAGEAELAANLALDVAIV